MTADKKRISTFSKTMTMEEAEREKKSGTPVGESLKRAEREYEERRRKK